MTALALSKASPASAETDALVVGVYDDGAGSFVFAPGADEVTKATRKAKPGLRDRLAAVTVSTQVGALTRVPRPKGLAAGVVVAVGLGRDPGEHDPDTETLRAAAAAAVRSLAGRRAALLALPTDTPERVDAVTVGAGLGGYVFDRYRGSDSTARPSLGRATVFSPHAGDRAVKTAFDRARHLLAGVRLCRDLVNTPAADLPPAELAEEAVRAGKESGLKVQVLDEKALAKGGYGGLLGVGKGSANPPRLARVAYSHPRAKKTLVLCGKGITFDTGGLSLKPPESMKTMKSDKGGAAAVLGALVAIARIRPKVNVVGYLACAENMPSGTAQRPSDVLTTYGGTTVEVLNTDAEGRLVLADALGRAKEDEPDLLVDVATLTGAQVTALGNRYFAVMGTDRAREQVVDAAGTAGESAWPMPLPREQREALSSEVADIANVGKERVAQMLTAGVFLQEFVADAQPWAHLDIAGPAFSDKTSGHVTKGGTGVSVRTLVRLAEDMAG